MLLSFSIRNFRSFADEMTLSMASPGFQTNIPRKGETWEDSTERVAAIFGPNASGKTTILEAMWGISQALRSPGSRNLWQPNVGMYSQDPTEYTIDFVADNVRFEYEVHIASWGVQYESLASYPKGSRRVLFLRRQDSGESDIQFEKGASLTGPTSEVLRITRPPALFLSMAFKYGHKPLVPIARALAANLGVDFITFRDRQDEQVLKRVLVEMLDAPREQIDLVGALLKAADLGITGVEVHKEEVPEKIIERALLVIEALRSGEGPVDEDAIPRLKEVVLFQHRSTNGEHFMLPVHQESAGTITWLTTAWHALNALRDGSVLLIDELDASLHPELSRYLVKLFLMPHFNTHGAQLIFNTHDVSLLGNSPTRLLDPNIVWFTEKNEFGHSELFSLADFDNRPGNNSQRRYLAGQFGAVPDIDDTLLMQYIATQSSESWSAVG